MYMQHVTDLSRPIANLSLTKFLTFQINKPLIEKRRRERINECLNQLQELISQLDKEKYKVSVMAGLLLGVWLISQHDKEKY